MATSCLGAEADLGGRPGPRRGGEPKADMTAARARSMAWLSTSWVRREANSATTGLMVMWSLLSRRIRRRMAPMSGSDKRKQSLYFPDEMLKEIANEAMRQDRSLSWIVQKSWKAARKDLMSMPSVRDQPGGDDSK